MSAILFDMDGVLADNSDYHVKAWVAFAREYGRDLEDDDVRSRLGFNNHEYMRFVLGREPTKEEVHDAIERKEALYRTLYAPELIAPNGLIPFLEALQRVGVACAVATSAPSANVDFILDGLGIRKFFREVVDASMVKRGKPDPELYLQAAARLRVDPRSCVVFEDAIAGIQAGKRADMQVVALTTSFPSEVLQKQSPDAIANSFVDLQTASPALEIVRHICGETFCVIKPHA